ncbi:uncharacterized protein LOC133814836 [Humulus lupulus]|uniref:uncharacterized protein LOC133814836 n=1 Tax=Humulus lupulus TaxID=3486 RepID=UPI002B4009BA|nr:uncharacterized protein LOC133814836 [Humulus lupulus]
MARRRKSVPKLAKQDVVPELPSSNNLTPSQISEEENSKEVGVVDKEQGFEPRDFGPCAKEISATDCEHVSLSWAAEVEDRSFQESAKANWAQFKESLPSYGGQVMEQPIEYEWLPTKCSNCKKLGHTANSFPSSVAPDCFSRLIKKLLKMVLDLCWSVPKRTGSVMSAAPVPIEQSRNSYSVLQENLKNPNDLVLPTVLNGVLQHHELERIILLIWKAHLAQIDVIQENAQLLHCRVRICSRNQDFCLTIVYGSNNLETRRLLWHDLANLHLPIKPWIILGDFNAAFNINDRIGGRPISVKEMEDAQQWLALGLVEEMKIMGPYFTWSKNQEGGITYFLSWTGSFLMRLGWIPFCCLQHFLNGRETVLDSWSKPFCTKGNRLEKLVGKLIRLKHVLKRFNWRVMGDVVCNFERSKSLFQLAQSKLYDDPCNISLISTEREAYLEFSRQEKISESFLPQKSKITWLHFGDESSSYFYASLKKRKVANQIVSFISADGMLVYDYEMVTLHFLQHFQSFLGCASRANGHIDSQSITYGPVLDFDTQLELIKPFSPHDVKVALFSIHSVKSLGLDGYGAGFFKDLWKDIGKEVSMDVLDFFESGNIPQCLNDTLLVLILKVDQPTNAADFRPIACCTTIYKCISKMLCGRLSTVLPSLINQSQGAFIKHRSLAYNVLIFQDLIKGYNRKNSSPRCAMKIDLSKAYDSIDWDFLENLLNALCFPSRFIRWIMHFRFHPMCKSLNLVNLCFADDLLIFCKATTQSVQIIHRALAEFKMALGLSINHNKSHIYFGGLSEVAKAPALNCTNLIEGSFPLKYFEVPLRPTKCKASEYDIIPKKIRLRLNTWATRNLSYAGRTQLVQSVLLGIQNYWMSIFLLPQSVVRDIDRLCINFLWGEKGSRSKFHLSSWEFVCRPKAYGGLGFREGPAWNKILLAKFIWAISSKQDQLWVKWVNNIYLKGSQLWDYILKQDVSWYWRKLIKLCNSMFGLVLAAAEVHGKLRLGKLYNHFLPGEKVDYVDESHSHLFFEFMPSDNAFDIYASADAPLSRKKSSRQHPRESSGEPSRERARLEDPPAPSPSKSTTPPPPPPRTTPSTN